MDLLNIRLGWKLLIFLLLFLILIFIFVRNTLTPIFFSLAEIEAVRIANLAINEVVGEEAEDLHYDDLIEYVVNKDGYIVLMQPNIKYINIFTSNISLKIQRKLAETGKMDVSIPLARIFGIEFFAGFGPSVEAKIIPVGFVHPPLIMDSFTAAGINQTRHKIYLLVEVKLKLIVPFNSKYIEVKADVPVIEVTILGKVPQVYIGFKEEELSGIINRYFQGTE